MSDDRHQTRACLDAETLAAFIDGRLEPREREAVEAHLAACEDCYEVWMEGGALSTASITAPKKTGWTRAIAASVAAILMLTTGYLWSSRPWRDDASLITLVEAVGSNRFSLGRLAAPFEYGPPPSVVRGAPPRQWPLTVQQQLVELKLQGERERSPSALHFAGVALLVEGNVEAAIETLEEAVAGAPTDAAARVALSVAYLERAAQDGGAQDAGRALDLSLHALRLDPTLVAARFNAALASEILGPASESRRFWEEYLAADPQSPWAAEARSRLDAIGKQSHVGRGSTFETARHLRETLLVEWAHAELAGREFDFDSLNRSVESLEREGVATRDRTIVHAVRSLVPQTTPARCWANMLSFLSQWRAAYEHERYADAESALQSAGASGPCTVHASLELDISRAFTTSAMTGVAAGLDRLISRIDDFEGAGYFREGALITILGATRALRQVNFDEGTNRYRSCIALAERGQEWDIATWCKARLADALDELGQSTEAWALASDALSGLTWISGPRRAYLVLSPMVLMAERGRLHDLTFYLAGLTLVHTSGWESPAGSIFGHGRRAKATIGHDANTSQLELALARNALADIADTGRREVQAFELSLLEGEMNIETSPAWAIEALTRGIAFVESRSNWYRTSRLLYMRGRAHRAAGNNQAAEQDWQRAAELVAGQASQLESAALRVSRLDHAWDVFDRLLHAQRDRPLAALVTADWSHARDLSAAVSALRPSATTDPVAVQRLLPDGTTVLMYASLTDRLLRWTITNSAIQPSEAEVGHARLAQMVQGSVRAISGVSRETIGGSDLFDLLIPQEILVGTNTLVVIPDGPLSQLPFAALRDRTGTYLIERVDVATAPSLSILGKATQAPWSQTLGPVVIVAAGEAREELGLAALPGVDKDVEIATRTYGKQRVRVLTGASGFRSFRSAAATAGVIQFSGHSVLDLRVPARSRLLFSGDESHDLALSALEDLRMVPGALVFLNACETAAGRRYRGEGAISLSRPFLAAGASGVVGSLWRVADRDATSFSATFHQQLTSSSPIRATAAAQRALIAEGRPPASWAGFVYSGGLSKPAALDTKG